MLAPAYAVEKITDNLSFQKAAALWSTYLTAYGLLIDQANAQTGQFVLINAASSAVGISAIQIANAAGAIPIAISTSAAKRAALLEAGASYVIVSSEQDIAEEVNRITHHKGANIILDAVGGPAFSGLLAAAALKARILIYGTLSPEPATINTWEILKKNVQISGFTVADVNFDPSRLQAAKTFIYEGLASGKLNPVIAGSFTLDAIADAHRFLESNKQVEKVIISL
ncbi:zinc-binding dehydrogenase [Mucilaginibacter limnophilus]|uniref:zinc-binding dehydrogenase n=1 Tax=Mucilaginibacter limnophilus TaxID=1932778 RepID=UPI0013E2EDA0|nr:zinc-binding dehydrogenase [Mucilaginibacter limnophilus]